MTERSDIEDFFREIIVSRGVFTNYREIDQADLYQYASFAKVI